MHEYLNMFQINDVRPVTLKKIMMQFDLPPIAQTPPQIPALNPSRFQNHAASVS